MRQAYSSPPFASYTVVVADDALKIPLEAQSLSVFGPNHLNQQWEAQRLIAHELAHQWFGNSLTARAWADIWLHEVFACYAAAWIWSEASGNALALHTLRRATGDALFVRLLKTWTDRSTFAVTLHARSLMVHGGHPPVGGCYGASVLTAARRRAGEGG